MQLEQSKMPVWVVSFGVVNGFPSRVKPGFFMTSSRDLEGAPEI